MIGSYVISVRRNYPKGSRFNLVTFLKQLYKSFWGLATIIIVVVGVVGIPGVMKAVFTPTESAAIAVIYSLFISVFVYKGLNWKGLWKVLGDAVNLLSIVLILISTSGLFGFLLAYLKVPAIASNAIMSITSNPIGLCAAVKPHPAHSGLREGHGPDHPDRDAHPFAACNLHWH